MENNFIIKSQHSIRIVPSIKISRNTLIETKLLWNVYKFSEKRELHDLCTNHFIEIVSQKSKSYSNRHILKWLKT